MKRRMTRFLLAVVSAVLATCGMENGACVSFAFSFVFQSKSTFFKFFVFLFFKSAEPLIQEGMSGA